MRVVDELEEENGGKTDQFERAKPVFVRGRQRVSDVLRKCTSLLLSTRCDGGGNAKAARRTNPDQTRATGKSIRINTSPRPPWGAGQSHSPTVERAGKGRRSS